MLKYSTGGTVAYLIEGNEREIECYGYTRSTDQTERLKGPNSNVDKDRILLSNKAAKSEGYEVYLYLADEESLTPSSVSRASVYVHTTTK